MESTHSNCENYNSGGSGEIVRTPKMAAEGKELPVPQNEGEQDTFITHERLFQPKEEAYR